VESAAIGERELPFLPRCEWDCCSGVLLWNRPPSLTRPRWRRSVTAAKHFDTRDGACTQPGQLSPRLFLPVPGELTPPLRTSEVQIDFATLALTTSNARMSKRKAEDALEPAYLRALLCILGQRWAACIASRRGTHANSRPACVSIVSIARLVWTARPCGISRGRATTICVRH
jgi:hypothetical protein